MKFAEIVRSSPHVRQAFAELPAVNLWWRCVLALHGKPVDGVLDTRQTAAVLAQGFRFYGRIYSGLAAVLAMAAWWVLAAEVPQAGFWASVLGASSLYLLAACRLAFFAARRFVSETIKSSAVLLVFFIAVMIFAACFTGGVMVFAREVLGGYSLWSVIVAGAVLLLGVGSYILEILFLFFYCAAPLSDSKMRAFPHPGTAGAARRESD